MYPMDSNLRYAADPLLLELLRGRGVTEEADIEEFISEKPQKTYDPFLLPDMEAGVDLILSEIAEGAPICIYGDYDADGVTSVSLLLQILSPLASPGQISYYIPSRFDEGYGLNREAIRTIFESGVKLLVTVDCGSVSYAEVEYAKELGLSVLVTDHHSVTDRMANCLHINPKRSDSVYPCPYLAGVGVAFKLAQALQQRAGLPKSVLTAVLDLVALGTVGDIVPLLDENRTMVKYGMRVLREGRRPGLRRLIEQISLVPATVSSENIAFAIVPHINAAGRMGSARVGVELMLAEDEDTIVRCVDTLVESNYRRKTVQEDTYKRCIGIIEDEKPDASHALIIYAPDAHEGIAGIVAGKIREKYERPTLIVTPSGEDGAYLKGTGRSTEKVDLYLLLKTCEDLFERFGGHAGACGFLMKKEHLPEMRRRIQARLAEQLAGDAGLFEPERRVDAELSAGQITFALADMLALLEPFGSRNPQPVFRLCGMRARNVSRLGKEGQHVRFTAEDENGARVSCILFGQAAEVADTLLSGAPFTLFGTVEAQVWNGTRRIQMLVSGIEA